MCFSAKLDEIWCSGVIKKKGEVKDFGQLVMSLVLITDRAMF